MAKLTLIHNWLNIIRNKMEEGSDSEACSYLKIFNISTQEINMKARNLTPSGRYSLTTISHCHCCKDCKSKLKYVSLLDYSESDDKYSIRPDSGVEIYFSDCVNHMSFKFKGFYKGNNEFSECTLVFENQSIYTGTLKDGLPYGNGILELHNNLIQYQTLCNMSPTHIEVCGFWIAGILDTSDNIKNPFSIIVYLENKSKFDKYYTMLYKNCKLLEGYFIPNEESDIFYFQTDCLVSYLEDDDSSSLYGSYHGTIINGNRTQGKINYCKPQNKIASFEGTFENEKYKEGTVLFNESSINKTFTGKFDASGKALLGTICYKNGCEYSGFVNSLFISNGQGTMNYFNQKMCECCLNGIHEKHKKREEDEFTMVNTMFDKIEGVWEHDKLLLEHKLTNSCDQCSGQKEFVCLLCSKYYCRRCYLKHQIKFKYDYHNIFKFNDTDCIDTLNSYLLLKEQHIASSIMKQLTVINEELKELESLQNGGDTQSKKKKKKKKKKQQSPIVDITTIDGEAFFDTREELPITPTHDDYDSSFDNLLKVFKVEYNSDLTKKSK
jgi:hypothetical protein